MCRRIIVMLILLISNMVLGSCASQEPDVAIENNDEATTHAFPLYENGYPNNNYISINGELYLTQVKKRDTILEETIEVSITDEAEKVIVVLPQGAIIHKWAVKDAGIGIELIESISYLPDLNGEYSYEGSSPYLCEFVFAINDRELLDKVTFGLFNIDSSVYSESYYTLILSFVN